MVLAFPIDHIEEIAARFVPNTFVEGISGLLRTLSPLVRLFT